MTVKNLNTAKKHKQRIEPRLALEIIGIDSICDRLAQGESLRAIGRSIGLQARRILDWIQADSHRSAQYARAREAQADHFAEEIIEISDKAIGKSAADVQARRLAVDSRKWLASKMAPKRYGDRNEDTAKSDLVFIRDLSAEQLRRKIDEMLPELISDPGIRQQIAATARDLGVDLVTHSVSEGASSGHAFAAPPKNVKKAS